MEDKSKAGAHPVPEKRRYVYFVQCDHDRGPIKIGYTDNVHTRLQKLQNGSPSELYLLLSVFGNAAEIKALERTLHQRFAAYRQRGEWFEWNAELAALIDELCRPHMEMLAIEFPELQVGLPRRTRS